MSKKKPDKYSVVEFEPVQDVAYTVIRDGAGFTLFKLNISDSCVVSKTVVHHQDMLSITIEKLRQELSNDFK